MVDFSDNIKNSDNEIRFFLKTKMYNNKNVLAKNKEGMSIIKRLFKRIKLMKPNIIAGKMWKR